MVDWVSKDPKQHLTDFRHCRCKHFSWRNAPSCYEISWKHLFKRSSGTAARRDVHWEPFTEFPFPGTPGSREATARAGCEREGGGFGFCIDAYRLEKGLHSSWTASPSFLIPAASRYESLLFLLPRCIQLCLTLSSWRGVLACASRKGAEHLYPSVAKRDLLQVSLWWTASSSKLETGMTFPISIYWNLKDVVSLFPLACPMDSHLSSAELF